MGRSSLPGVLKATIRKRVAFGWESAMSHQYEVGNVVTVFQISLSKELVIEGMLMSSTGSSSPISQA
jgi:hypothetical protein